MSARFAGGTCFQCGLPITAGSLCDECTDEVREQTEAAARQQLADADEVRDAQ